MHPRQCRIAVAALTVMVCCFAARLCEATVVVIANRSTSSVAFQIQSDGKFVSHHSLQPAEVLPLRIPGELSIHFEVSSEPRDYSLNSDAAYYFFGDGSSELDLSQLNFGEKEPKRSSATKAKQDDLQDSGDGISRIPVRVLVDDDFLALKRSTEEGIQVEFAEAASYIERTCGVHFDVVDSAEWESPDDLEDFGALSKQFRSSALREDVWLTLGFLRQLPATRGELQLGKVRPLQPHVIIRDWSDGTTRKERVELIVHALGKFLGAVESPEPDSVMRPMFGDGLARAAQFRLQMDLANTLATNLVADGIRRENVREWSELNPRTRARIKGIHAAIEGLPDAIRTPGELADRNERRGSSMPADPDGAAMMGPDANVERIKSSRPFPSGPLRLMVSAADLREFGTTSLPTRNGSREITKRIDDAIAQALAAQNIAAAGPATDEQFLRRATFDVIGRPPTLSEIKEYVESDRPDKKEVLIDRLLADPNFGKRMADLWLPLMFDRTLVNHNMLSSDPLRWWLENEFNRNTSWDHIARQLIASEGPQNVNPAVTLMMGGKNGILNPPQATATIAKSFLGVQLECAQCHDHPFADWKQTEFWGIASFFRYIKSEDNWTDDILAASIPTDRKRAFNGMMIVGRGITDSPVPQPLTKLEGALDVAPAVLTATTLNASGSRRLQFAAWLTSPENPYFARSLVNRIWAQYFGRGLINPLNDLKPDDTGPAAELLSSLAQDFIARQFDIKQLMRGILLSEAYGRESASIPEVELNALQSYHHLPMRTLDSYQLFDALGGILGEQVNARESASGLRWQFGPRERFADYFERELPIPAYHRGILQMLRLMNEKAYENGIAARTDLILQQASTPGAAVEELFLLTIGRRPTSSERAAIIRYVERSDRKDTAMQDALWALLQSSEFVLLR